MNEYVRSMGSYCTDFLWWHPKTQNFRAFTPYFMVQFNFNMRECGTAVMLEKGQTENCGFLRLNQCWERHKNNENYMKSENKDDI